MKTILLLLAVLNSAIGARAQGLVYFENLPN